MAAVYLTITATILMENGVRAWTGEIHGRVVCDVCGDSSIGPEDHVLSGKSTALRLSFPFTSFINLYFWGWYFDLFDVHCKKI